MRRSPRVVYAASAAVGYLLGSVQFSQLTARAHGIDLKSVGDRNPGAWNALEQLGPGRAWPAFAGDGAKGLAAGAAGRVADGTGGAYAGVAGAMLGHCFPPWHGLHGGGKGVMTFTGGAFALSPRPASLCLLGCAVVTAWSRSFAAGARTAVFGFPLVQLAFDPPERVAATGLLMCIIGARFAPRLLFARHADTRGPASSGSGGPPRG